MPAFKTPDLNQRGSASRDAKARALELLRAKAAPADPAAVAERRAAQEAREAAEAKRREAHRAAIDAEKTARTEARELARMIAEEEAAAAAAAAEAAAAKKLRALPNAAELKAARDARYAARKARQK